MGGWNAGSRSCVSRPDAGRPDPEHAEKYLLKSYFRRVVKDEHHVKTRCGRQRLIHAICEPASVAKDTYPQYPQQRVNAGLSI